MKRKGFVWGYLLTCFLAAAAAVAILPACGDDGGSSDSDTVLSD